MAGRRIGETHPADIESHRKILQFAGSVVAAGGAVPAMVGEQEFKDVFAIAAESFGVGFNRHAGLWRGGTGGFKVAARGLHHAHAAGAVDREFRMIAKRREFDADFSN
ncbi:hypothetical protein SDC9_157338 [bioreactor metagenome]|uniref:Uncharacterized protein n=1 Tax=bioreactor metagenome TaxID=1076179 RepID=A0A645F6P8_9ZZZZ